MSTHRKLAWLIIPGSFLLMLLVSRSAIAQPVPRKLNTVSIDDPSVEGTTGWATSETGGSAAYAGSVITPSLQHWSRYDGWYNTYYPIDGIAAVNDGPPVDVIISGPTTGLVGTIYTFTAYVSPVTATQPITYTWSPVPITGQGSPTTTHNWTTPGPHAIIVTATNAIGSAIDTHVITITSTNTQPTLSGLPDQVVPMGGSADNAIDLWVYAYDAEEADADLIFTISNSPNPNAGVSIDSNRYIDINPIPAWSGVTGVEIQVQDTGGLTDTDSFSVTVGVTAADFTADPCSGAPPLTVQFTDLSTGDPTMWRWDFGDGSLSYLQHPTHTYTVFGAYTVTLIVTGTGGADALTRPNYITVLAPQTYTLAVDIVGQGSVDLAPPGGNYNQGTVVTLTATPDPPDGVFVGWSGDLVGTINPTYTVMDADKTITATFSFPPQFTSVPVEEAWENTFYTYTVTATDADVGDTLIITAPTPLPGWLTLTDYGDGTATLNGTPTGADVGAHSVALQVRDIAELTSAQIFTITVAAAGTNTQPTLSGLPDQIVPMGGSADNAIDLWVYAYDAEEADADLTFTISNSPNPNAGVSIDSNRYIDINPTAAWSGVTDVEIQVQDTGGLTDTDAFSVTVELTAADFTADPRSGAPPLIVQFTDLSTGAPTIWKWDFGDGSSVSSLQHPTHTYTIPGTYTVTLTITSTGGIAFLSKTSFITVSSASQPPALTDINPPQNAVTAPLTTTVSATYDQPISPATVTSHTFAVHGMQSGLVTATHGVVNGNTIIVTPTRSFHQGELVYAVATTRTLNVTGTGPLSGTLWQFNAGEVTDRCVGGFTEVYTGSLTGVDSSSVAWGDYDNDGDLDILLTGSSDGGLTSEIYQNTGSGFSQVYTGSLAGISVGSVAWGDYDNDGDLDILLTGYSASTVEISKIYQNTGSGFSEVYTGSLTSVKGSSVAWGDYDNDGNLDILLTGLDSGGTRISKVYHNTDSGFSQVYAGSLPGVWQGSAVWGDYDNDGDLDILVTGQDSSLNPVAKVYQNTGDGFTEVYAGSLTGVRWGSVAWGDYDNDGDLDILLTGSDGVSLISKLYQNTGSGFTEVYAGSLADVYWGSVAWGDYDNDGDLDILLTGYGDYPSDFIAAIHQNTGSGFSQVHIDSLVGVGQSSVAWGDYDNDGDLDILLTGNSSDGPIAKVYRNDDCSGNQPPAAHAGDDQTVGVNATVTLDGSGSTDPDGDLPLTYHWAQTGGQAVTLSDITVVSPTFTAPSSATVLTFTLTVTDTAGLTDTDDVVVTVANTPPTISNVPNQSTAIGVAVGPIPFTVSDAETDAGDLSLSADSSNLLLVPLAYVLFGGSGADRTVTITPTMGLTGTATITITVSDGDLSTHDTFILSVGINSPPEFRSIPVEEATVGVLYTYAVAASDADAGDILTFTAPVSAAWLTLTQLTTRTGTLSGTPASAGDYPVVLQATDGQDSVTQAFTITVSIPNQSPVADAGPNRVAGVSTVVTLDGSGSTDPDEHTPLAYGWTQTGGPAVALSDAAAVSPTFAAPGTPTVLDFALVVTDALGLTSAPDTVVVTVTDTCTPLVGARIAGPTAGYTGTRYTFTAITAPSNATLPIIITWSPQPDSGQSSDVAGYTWATTGTKTITLTVAHCGGTEVTTHTVSVLPLPVGCPQPLRAASITGVTSGYTDTLYTFTGVITPASATQPLTYTWSPEPQTGQGTAHAAYRWATPGTHTVTLLAQNCTPPSVVTVSGPPHAIVLSTVPRPAEGDAYEPDDTCAQAQFISGDGIAQIHTFHDAGDEDWIAVYATAGVTYVVEARVPPTSTADLILEAHDACAPGGYFDDDDPTFSPDIRLIFTPPASGVYYLRLFDSDVDSYGAQALYHLSVQAIQDTLPSGAIILVAGRYREADELQPNIHNVTGALYRFARTHGCSADQVAYLATDDTLEGVTALATRSNLRDAIMQAANKVGPDRPLTLYLMDHGSYDRFYLDRPSDQELAPLSLDGWLDDLEAAVPGVRVNVIVDACYSGSFIDPNQKVGAQDRVVIASTSASNYAYATNAGAAFSDSFLNALEQGLSLRAAFDEATWAVQQAHPDQRPWLDDNGDGLQNDWLDGRTATKRSFACEVATPDLNWPPHIAALTVTNLSGVYGDIWASVQDDQLVQFVRAVVYPPSWRPPASGDELGKEPLATQLDSRGNDLYAIEYGKFRETGLYRLVVYAQDDQRLEARPREIEISIGGITVKPADPLTYLEIPIEDTITAWEFPTGALTETTTFTYTAYTAEPDGLSSGLRFAGHGFHLDAYRYAQTLPSLQFQRPATVTVHYSAPDVEALDEETLQLYYRVDEAWSAEGLTVLERDRENHRLVLASTHASEFALFGEPKQQQVFLPVVLRQ